MHFHVAENERKVTTKSHHENSTECTPLIVLLRGYFGRKRSALGYFVASVSDLNGQLDEKERSMRRKQKLETQTLSEALHRCGKVHVTVSPPRHSTM